MQSKEEKEIRFHPTQENGFKYLLCVHYIWLFAILSRNIMRCWGKLKFFVHFLSHKLKTQEYRFLVKKELTRH